MFDAGIASGGGGIRILDELKKRGIVQKNFILDFNERSDRFKADTSLIFREGGAGTNPKLAVEKYGKYYGIIQNNLKEFLGRNKPKNILFIAGGGNGVGSGTLLLNIDNCLSMGNYDISVMVTIPKDPPLESDWARYNAIVVIDRLQKDYLYNGKIKSIFVVDNNYCYKKYGDDGEWSSVNSGICDSLILFPSLTEKSANIEFLNKDFDIEDFRTHLTAYNGFVDIMKFNIETFKLNDEKFDFNSLFNSGSLLCPDYDVKKCQSYILAIGLSPDIVTLGHTTKIQNFILDNINKKLGRARHLYVSYKDNRLRQNISVNLLLAGLPINKKLSKLIDKTKKGKEQITNKVSQEKNIATKVHSDIENLSKLME